MRTATGVNSRIPTFIRWTSLSAMAVVAVFAVAFADAAAGIPASRIRSAVLAADPTDTNRWYALREDEFYRSDSGGRRWMKLPASPPDAHQPHVFPDGTVQVQRTSRDARATTFWRSRDAGATWTSTTVQYPVRGTLVRDPSTPGVLYLVGAGMLEKSEDGGATWRSLEPESAVTLDEGQRMRIVQLSVDPADAKVLRAYAAIVGPYTPSRGASPPATNMLLQSTDGGRQWERVDIDPSDLRHMTDIVTRIGGPTFPQHLFFSRLDVSNRRRMIGRLHEYDPVTDLRQRFEHSVRPKAMSLGVYPPLVAFGGSEIYLPTDRGLLYSSASGRAFRTVTQLLEPHGGYIGRRGADGSLEVFFSDRRGVYKIVHGQVARP